MLRLPSVFSSGALFLHSAPLTVSGESDSDSVTLKLSSCGELYGAYTAPVIDDCFKLELITPSASLKKYEMTVTSGEDALTITDILFGELFLASGQSNMEWPTRYMPRREEIYDALSGKSIRVYYGKPKDRTSMMPSEPERYHTGSWTSVDGVPTYADGSALALSFALSLYEYFEKEGREMPVGILSLSLGGIPIETYLSEEDILSDTAVYEYIRETGVLPSDERWNTLGDSNRMQPTAFYNYMIAPVLGVRVRAMLWYQGENNVHYEESERRIYATLLECLHKGYKRRFAPSEDEPFPMFTVQLFPFAYKKDEEKSCMCYYVNDALLSLAKKRPDEFYTVPICDLGMPWAFFIDNSPIHPLNKFELAPRLTDTVTAALYGRKARQKRAAYMRSVRREDGKIYIRFRSVGSGLYIKGSRIKGLYVRSRKGEYTPTECRVIGKDTLEVYHPGICTPYHVAYAVSDLEYGVNLYAGEYPVLPFSTEMPHRVMRKPWLDTSIDFDVVCESLEDGAIDYYPRPIYHPLSDEELCYDSYYSLTGRSLRVRGKGEYGFKVKASHFAPLDLYNYSSLGVSLLSKGELGARIALVYADGKRVECEGVPTEYRYGSFSDYTFDLRGLSRGEITELHFVFKSDYPYVCADAFKLTPKK